MTFYNADERQQSKPHPMIGAQFGQYKIVDMVGGGGMGVVFRARQEMIDRDVAVKLLPPQLAHDEINTKRLEREAKALAKLNHPNIVTTFDFGITDYHQAFLVMELVDGENLKEILQRETRLEVERALKVFIQLADAMRFAHSHDIIHRDLKPHNVMLARKPSPDFVKILDFGIARLSDSQKLTRVGEIIGSPLYMSPEQCLSDPVDGRTDIYSFGILMFVCLTGQVPWKGDTLYETVERKCTQPVPRMKDVAPYVDVPPFLEELIGHCLAVEPDERFQTMDEVKDLLESVLVSLKKSTTMEGTRTLEKPKIPSHAQNSTLREKMQALKNEQAAMQTRASSAAPPPGAPGGAPSAAPQAAPAAAHAESSPSAVRPRPSVSSPASRPNKSRPIEDKRGIVLTPGMIIIGVIVLLACMVGGVIVGISVAFNGTFLPPVKQQASSNGNGTVKSVEPSPPSSQSNATTDGATTEKGETKEAPAVKNEFASSEKPAPATIKVEKKIRPPADKPVAKTQVASPPPVNTAAPPRPVRRLIEKRREARDSHIILPRHHTVPPATEKQHSEDIWYGFKNRRRNHQAE